MKNLIDENVSLKNLKIGVSNWIRVESEIENSILTNSILVNFRCNIKNAIIDTHVQIASQVVIGGNNSETIIGSSSWLGANSMICEGIRIGKNCVIGANTIVNKNIPDNSIVYGNETLSIKKRNFKFIGNPDFSAALKNKLILQDDGKYFGKGGDGNYNSALILGSNHKIGKGNILIGNSETQGHIRFGKGVEIGNQNIFEGAGTIEIGDGTKIGNNVHIVSNSHDYRLSDLPMIFQPVKIGANVIIEDNSIILGGVLISDNTIVKKGSFVRK